MTSPSPWRLTGRRRRPAPVDDVLTPAVRPRPKPALAADQARRLAVSCALADARAALERARTRAVTVPEASAKLVAFQLQLLDLERAILSEVR